MVNKDNKKLVVDSMFIKEALKDKLSLSEFLLLLYFDNSYESLFDIKLIKKVLNMSEEEILNAYSNLLKKKIIKTVAEKNEDGKVIEKVCLDNFYKSVISDKKKSNQAEEKNYIFSVFEKNLGKPLSPMDYEIINAWIDHDFSEELIIAALKEAKYNGVVSLRYIDKVLYEWNKKGIKNVEDIKKSYVSDDTTEYKVEKGLLDYNWLDEK